MRRIRKIADCFQANHRYDLIATLFASAGVNKTAHLWRLEKWRLLVNKRDETQGLRCSFSGKTASERQRCRHAAAIVIRTRCAENRIVVRADKNDFRACPMNFDFNIMAGTPI